MGLRRCSTTILQRRCKGTGKQVNGEGGSNQSRTGLDLGQHKAGVVQPAASCPRQKELVSFSSGGADSGAQREGSLAQVGEV